MGAGSSDHRTVFAIQDFLEAAGPSWAILTGLHHQPPIDGGRSFPPTNPDIVVTTERYEPWRLSATHWSDTNVSGETTGSGLDGDPFQLSR